MPARLEQREREITARAETMREQVAQLTAQLDELGQAAEEVRITRKTLLGLPDPGAARAAGTEAAGSSGLPGDHGGVHRGDHPLRARQVCEAMDLAVAPNSTNKVRLKLKRLAGRGILTETEPGLFTQPRP
ncbi:hypothetical protein [Streptomyces sp. NPDC055506]